MSLVDEVKELIITSLNLPDLKLSDIDENAPLFGEGLGLDSVDALELNLAIQKKYDFELDPESTNLSKVFYNVSSLADFIGKHKNGA